MAKADKNAGQNADTATATPPETFGVGNLLIQDGVEEVTVKFDPQRIIGEFKSGNPKVCSTGAYRILDVSGVRMMLHVIGRKI